MARAGARNVAVYEVAFEDVVGVVDLFGSLFGFALQVGVVGKAVGMPNQHHFSPSFLNLRQVGADWQFQRLVGVVDFFGHLPFVLLERMRARGGTG